MALAAVLSLSAVIAVIATRVHTGSGNEVSRLAAVESLVERHTFAIDESSFVIIPEYEGAPGAEDRPFSASASSWRMPTDDMVKIAGHYYSHKNPVPALFLAGYHALWRAVSGRTARQFPASFYYWITLGSSGAAYVVSVSAVYLMGRALGLPIADRLMLCASFGLATMAIAYVQSLNDHILLLAVSSLTVWLVARLEQREAAGAPAKNPTHGEAAALGFLAGAGYTIDSGAGPVLLAATAALLAARFRRLGPVARFALAAAPWLLLHHAINYAIGGTWRPLASVPEYFDWPGSHFNRNNLTGVCSHDSIGKWLHYAWLMLFGELGFVGHDPPLYIAPVAMVAVWRRRPTARLELGWLAGWSIGTWILYSLLSNNFSGECCSVRWFLPLLAGAYYLFGLWLKVDRTARYDLVVLSLLAAPLAWKMWRTGPWSHLYLGIYWSLQAVIMAACAMLLMVRRFRRRD